MKKKVRVNFRFLFLLNIVSFLSSMSLYSQDDLDNRFAKILKKAHESRTTDTAFYYLNQYLKLAEKTHKIDKKARVYYDFTMFSYLAGFYSKAILYSDTTLILYQDLKDTNGIIAAINWKANIYMACKDTSKGFMFYNKALKLAEKINNKQYKGIIYQNLAEHYSNLGNKQKAIEYALKAISHFQKLDNKMGLADNYSIIARALYLNKLYDESVSYYKKSIDLYNLTADSHHVCLTYISLGLVYDKMNLYKLAEANIVKGLDITSRFNTVDGKPEFLIDLIEYYKKRNNYKQALLYSEKLQC